jgi:hypothetical protein
VSTIIDEAVFRRAKVEAARQGRPWSALLEDALLRYFENEGRPAECRRSVSATWGAISATPEFIREVMEDEDGWLDA